MILWSFGADLQRNNGTDAPARGDVSGGAETPAGAIPGNCSVVFRAFGAHFRLIFGDKCHTIIGDLPFIFNQAPDSFMYNALFNTLGSSLVANVTIVGDLPSMSNQAPGFSLNSVHSWAHFAVKTGTQDRALAACPEDRGAWLSGWFQVSTHTIDP